MTCKGICLSHRAKGIKTGRYANGQKRCQKCQIFIFWPTYCCPCCGYKLRLRPRNSKCKARIPEKRIPNDQELLVIPSSVISQQDSR